MFVSVPPSPKLSIPVPASEFATSPAEGLKLSEFSGQCDLIGYRPEVLCVQKKANQESKFQSSFELLVQCLFVTH